MSPGRRAGRRGRDGHRAEVDRGRQLRIIFAIEDVPVDLLLVQGLERRRSLVRSGWKLARYSATTTTATVTATTTLTRISACGRADAGGPHATAAPPADASPAGSAASVMTLSSTDALFGAEGDAEAAVSSGGLNESSSSLLRRPNRPRAMDLAGHLHPQKASHALRLASIPPWGPSGATDRSRAAPRGAQWRRERSWVASWAKVPYGTFCAAV